MSPGLNQTANISKTPARYLTLKHKIAVAILNGDVFSPVQKISKSPNTQTYL